MNLSTGERKKLADLSRRIEREFRVPSGIPEEEIETWIAGKPKSIKEETS